jgi:hypothetical protein
LFRFWVGYDAASSLHQAEVGIDAEIQGIVILHVAALLPEVFVVNLAVHTHQNKYAFVYLVCSEE